MKTKITPLTVHVLPTITRLEVIDEGGRAYVARPCTVSVSVQDDGKTLKLFVDTERA